MCCPTMYLTVAGCIVQCVVVLCLEHTGISCRIGEVLATKRTKVQFGSALRFYPSNERSWLRLVRVLLARRKSNGTFFCACTPNVTKKQPVAVLLSERRSVCRGLLMRRRPLLGFGVVLGELMV